MAAAAATPWPLHVSELDLAQPFAPIKPGCAETGHAYVGAVVAVRLHTRPLGFVHVDVVDDVVTEIALAKAIWQHLSTAITGHCRADGVTPPQEAAHLLPGLGETTDPPCLAARRTALADPPLVTVVVATRDRPDGLRETLRTLLAQWYPRFDVLVVDNAPSSSASADLVQTLAASDARLRYVREDRPGLGWAHRRGIADAHGEIVAFTDDDVHVDRHWLSGLVEGFHAAADVGCVTGLLLPYELESPSQVWYEQYGGFAKGFERRIFDLGAHRPPDPLFPLTVGRLGAGASMAFRRTVLLAAGGFDPALGPGTPARGGEDIDVFFKILARGHRLVYEPAALAYHVHRRNYAELRRQLTTWGIGFTAFLTAAALAKPGLVVRSLLHVPTAVRHTLLVRARQYRVSADTYPEPLTRRDYPADLRRAELRSLPAGPLAYLRGRAKVRSQVAAEAKAASRTRGMPA